MCPAVKATKLSISIRKSPAIRNYTHLDRRARKVRRVGPKGAMKKRPEDKACEREVEEEADRHVCIRASKRRVGANEGIMERRQREIAVH